MLQQNFKTAAELDLPVKTHEAAIKVLKMMEVGEINSQNFTMRRFGLVTAPRCIGGWVHHLAPGAASSLSMELTCPRGYPDGRYTIEHAKHALRSYLVTGTPDWGLGS